MRRAHRSRAYVFGVWTAIAVVSGIASAIGYAAFGGASPEFIAAVTAIAAGAILAMLADTMVPETFEQAHELAGLATAGGFLAAFVLSKMGA